MQLQIAMNVFYDLIMQSLHCSRNAYDRITQYLNCKILHGGTLLQPLPNAFGMQKYFSEDYVIPSPKLNDDQKKVLAEN